MCCAPPPHRSDYVARYVFIPPCPRSAHTRPAGNTNNYSVSGTTLAGTSTGPALPHQPHTFQPFLTRALHVRVRQPPACPPDLGLTLSELMFDNRRGGEHACGNQVDADRAAWAVRGSGKFQPRRSQSRRSWSGTLCSGTLCSGIFWFGSAAGAAGVARATAAGAGSRDGGGGGGVRLAVPGAGGGRVGGRSLVRDSWAPRGRGPGGGRPRPGCRADPAGPGSRAGLAAGDGVAARRVRSRPAASARASRRASRRSSARPGRPSSSGPGKGTSGRLSGGHSAGAGQATS
jgi:hypothetical protein